jgi:hypothetical protein
MLRQGSGLAVHACGMHDGGQPELPGSAVVTVRSSTLLGRVVNLVIKGSRRLSNVYMHARQLD